VLGMLENKSGGAEGSLPTAVLGTPTCPAPTPPLCWCWCCPALLVWIVLRIMDTREVPKDRRARDDRIAASATVCLDALPIAGTASLLRTAAGAAAGAVVAPAAGTRPGLVPAAGNASVGIRVLAAGCCAAIALAAFAIELRQGVKIAWM